MSSNTVLCVAVALLLNLAGSYGQQDVCGQASLNTKIIGGGDATQGFWPWHVGIYSISNKIIFCGGTLINKDWVLTSSLCMFFNGLDSSDLIIFLGRLNRSGPNPHEVNRTVSRIITHPNSTYSTAEYDIALLQLSSSVNFTAYIKPVCLAAAGSEFKEGLLSWVTGWGYTSYLSTDQFPNTLKETEIPIISNYICDIAYINSFSITDNMMCAGLTNGGKGSAVYDSGGPLVIKQGSRWIQSGIVSAITYGSEGSLPSVFTRVSKYQDWINTQIVNNQPGFITFPIYYNNTPKTTVSVPDTPHILYTPYVPKTPFIPDTPGTPGIPDIPDITYTPDIPDTPDTPGIPDIPDIPDIPCTHDIPYVPDIPDIDIDIFSGSSPNLHLFPFYFPIFVIISLIFCPCF